MLDYPLLADVAILEPANRAGAKLHKPDGAVRPERDVGRSPPWA